MVRFRGEERDILLRYLTPAVEHNNLILSRDDKMWIYTSKTSRPIPISMQQRLLGDASIGDVLNVELRNRYKGSMSRQGKSLLLELESITASALYDKIKLTVDGTTYRPIQAEFLTRNGKPLKGLRFVSFVKSNGKEIASQLEITDRIEKARITRIKFSGFQFTVLPDSYFSKDNLRNMQFGD
jgi:outer membrane lipoprotein-sorting protein